MRNSNNNITEVRRFHKQGTLQGGFGTLFLNNSPQS